MKIMGWSEKMELNPIKKSSLTRRQLLAKIESVKIANSFVENTSHARVNHLLGILMKTGWRELYSNYFTLENSSDCDMDLLDWILRGKIDGNEKPKTIRAWLAVQSASNLNKLLDFLRKSNGDVNFADETGQTILHVFLRSCLDYLPRKATFKVVKKLMEMGASVDAVDENNYTPLHIVAEEGEKALMKLILSSFTNVTAGSGYYGDTVLHDVVYACNEDNSTHEDQYTSIVRALLAKGANPGWINGYGITPIQLAVEYNFFEILRIFQANSADFHQLTSDGENLLHLACVKDKNPSSQLNIIDLLVSQGCDVNARDKDGQSPVHLAAKLHSEKLIERLIRLGGDVHSRTTNLRVTPLHLAASHNQPKNVEILLKAGADVDAEAKNGVTPLHIAASRDGIKSMKRLVEHGADVHRREKTFDFTPLHIATAGCKKKVELLLKRGVDANVSNRDGVTPLHLASLAGNARVVEVLLERGADVNCRGSELKLTPLHLASMSSNVVDARALIFNNKDLRDKSFFELFKWFSTPTMDGDNVAVAELLIENGIDVNVKDSIGRIPLHLATLQTTSMMIETLLQLGAHVDEYDDEGRTPLRNVLESKTTSGLNCLLKFGLDINDNDVVKEFDMQENKANVGLLIHAMKLKMLGLPVRDNYNCIQDAHLEVEQLKSLMIDGSKVSVYDFLHMKPRRQINLVENLMSMDLEFDFPEYFDVIHAKCRQAVNRMSLLRPALAALNQVTGTWWPEICAEDILSRFNNRNLRTLIDSAGIDVE